MGYWCDKSDLAAFWETVTNVFRDFGLGKHLNTLREASRAITRGAGKTVLLRNVDYDSLTPKASEKKTMG